MGSWVRIRLVHFSHPSFRERHLLPRFKNSKSDVESGNGSCERARTEKLGSHRSDHVTGVWRELTNLYNVQRFFHHFDCTILVSALNLPCP